MKHLIRRAVLAGLCGLFAQHSFAQTSGTSTPTPEEFKPSGAFSMQFITDYYAVISADTAASRGFKGGLYEPNGAISSTANTKGYQAFDLRRVYLGYDYHFTKTIAGQLLFAHENGASNGDVVLDANRGVYIKAANLRFKDVLPNSTLIIGQQGTAAFALTESIWGYRSIEKTMMDFRGFAGSNDLGIQLMGGFDQASTIGYSVMISNGNGAKTETDKYKKFAGELNAKLLDKTIVLEAYADYMDLAPIGDTNRNTMTVKGMASYVTDPITVGVEYAMQTMAGQSATHTDVTPNGFWVFARGYILPKQLNWYARYDMYDPNSDASTGRKETFIDAGLDWIPSKDAQNVHVMPNVWVDSYSDKSSAGQIFAPVVVGRLTFFYKF
jgi:hypothetical protein